MDIIGDLIEGFFDADVPWQLKLGVIIVLIIIIAGVFIFFRPNLDTVTSAVQNQGYSNITLSTVEFGAFTCDKAMFLYEGDATDRSGKQVKLNVCVNSDNQVTVTVK